MANALYKPTADDYRHLSMGLTIENLKQIMLVGAAPAGYNAAGDLITQTADGFDLNQIWGEFQASMALVNQQRSTIVSLLTFSVTQNIERVPQVTTGDFEKASEYGEPKGIRPAGGYFTLGYAFDWYDLAARYTWKFLADAPASQVQAINAMAIEADNRQMFNKVMEALYTNTNRVADINDQEVTVYSLYNGDGTVPPSYKTNTFDGTHTHYLTSGAATVDPGDLDDMYEHLREHGYSFDNGYSHLLLANETQVKTIRTFRAGQTPAGSAVAASYDFIPAQGSTTSILPVDQQLFGGGQPAGTYAGLNVAGKYGPWLIITDDMFPRGYMVGVATGGPENLGNPVGLREHSNASLRGLRLVKGPNPDYPLIDSFYQRGFGTGIRQRGGAVVMQVTTNATYTPATFG